LARKRAQFVSEVQGRGGTPIQNILQELSMPATSMLMTTNTGAPVLAANISGVPDTTTYWNAASFKTQLT